MRILKPLWFWAKLAILAVIGVWLYLQPGEITIAANDQVYEFPFGIAAIAVFFAILILSSVIAGLRGLLTLPGQLQDKWRAGRREKGWDLLTDSVVSLSLNQSGQAVKLTERAKNLLNDHPLAGILSAMAKRADGQTQVAETELHLLTDRPRVRAAGQMQLIDLAMDHGHMERADHIIQDALGRHPKNTRLIELGVETAVALSDWDRAIDYLTRLKKYTSDNNLAHDRRLACVYILRAQHKTHPLPDLKSAYDLAGYLGPVTARYTDQLMAEGRVKQAEKIIRRHWTEHPSPEAADSWMNILDTRQDSPSATDRHQWAEELADENPDHPLSHRLLARSAMAAELYGLADTHIEAALQAGADADLYRQRAELAKQSDQDLRSADHYLQLANSAPPAPHWVCQNCGNVMDEWEPICPVCDGFDTAVHTLPTAQNRLFLSGQATTKINQKNKLLPLAIN
jgi:HemY protein